MPPLRKFNWTIDGERYESEFPMDSQQLLLAGAVAILRGRPCSRPNPSSA
jgi:hypothetical protein